MAPRCFLTREWITAALLVLALASPAWTGGLTLVEVQRSGGGGITGLKQASALTVSPDGAHLYVAGRNDNAIAVCNRNAATSALTFVEAKVDGSDGVGDLRQTTAVVASPDGAHV